MSSLPIKEVATARCEESAFEVEAQIYPVNQTENTVREVDNDKGDKVSKIKVNKLACLENELV